MGEKNIYPVSAQFLENAYINKKQYEHLYRQSLENPDIFWAKQANQFVTWFSPWKTVQSGDFQSLDIQWFVGGQLNVSFNCLDRHLEKRAEQTALLWEGDDPKESKSITYAELYEEVCRFANGLKKLGIQKGDRVCIYMPMIPEVVVAMLACTRIGAIHTVVFGGFSPESLKVRILDADCRIVITADEGVRGGKKIPLKQNTDKALEGCSNVNHVVVVKRTGSSIPWNKQQDIWYQDLLKEVDSNCPPESMESEDPLFILYTSGSTGKPKGILHATGGYLVYVAISHRYVFNYHEGDIYWCTADVGWITGHSYLVYGPLCNGATTLIYEGVPHYRNFSRFWQIIDKHQVNIFYTAPTAIRALRREGDAWVHQTLRQSLKMLGTVGEPINPDVWEWYHQVVGNGRCPIVDTWWQTETGGILITPLPGATSLKPGAASWPFFGVVPEVVDDQGKPAKPNETGRLVITKPWPGMMKTIYGDKKRFTDTYFTAVSGKYFTGDSAHVDEDGYYWIAGRNDDVIKVSGHRIGTEEVESALVTHPDVSESAVVPIPHEIKGQGIYAFVTLKTNSEPSEDLKKALIQVVRNEIGPIATPEVIQWAQALPKTRSGKIMRRILRKIACDEIEDLGDVSTLSDPEVVESLIKGRQDMHRPD